MARVKKLSKYGWVVSIVTMLSAALAQQPPGGNPNQGGGGGFLTNATNGIASAQGEIITFAVILATFAFIIGALAKSGGMDWGPRVMMSSIIGLVLVGGATTLVGFFA